VVSTNAQPPTKLPEGGKTGDYRIYAAGRYQNIKRKTIIKGFDLRVLRFIVLGLCNKPLPVFKAIQKNAKQK
jgi:hypothetical protein